MAFSTQATPTREPVDLRAEWAARAKRDRRHTRRLLRKLSRRTDCVDVGAHAGEFLKELRRQCPKGRHVAVEPLPDYADDLAARFPDVTVHQCALSAEAGVAEFFRPAERPAWSGLRLQEYPEGTEVTATTVEVRRLDELVDHAGFVKIDVEGAELRVLKGATGLLAHEPILFFEFARTHAQAYQVEPAEMHDFLAEHGYEIYSLDGSGPHSCKRFTALCDRAHSSRYDRRAETNWVGRATLNTTAAGRPPQ